MRLHRSNQLERLFERLLEVCDEPLPDPFAREWIVAPHPGMGRWLERRWARERGIAALLHFPLPARALGELETFFSGADEAGKADGAAWEQAVLRWRIFRRLPGHAADPAFASLIPYQSDEAARFRLSGRIAAVFDQYQTYRPELVLDWEEGREPEDWQARLWRGLAAEDGAPPRHRARRDRDFLDRLKTRRPQPAPGCPTRLHLFGVNSLAPIYLELFAALGRRIETHCYQLSPCRGYWHDLERRQALPLLHLTTKDNSLLAGLGAVGRDFARLLLKNSRLENAAEDLYEEPEGDTLLAELQRGILDARPIPGSAEDRIAVAAADRSLELHCAWSPLGEVQALRDYLLDCFADESLRLTPGDILVAAPDIGRYAGTVRAVFGEAKPLIPFSLADRPAARETDVPGLFLALLDYLDSRCAVSELLELLEYPALHRRFGLEAEDLPLARRLLREAGAAWGLDEAQRGELGLAAAGAEHSLRHALDRLLLGYAMGDADAFHAGPAPCSPDGENAAAVLAGLLDLYQTLRRRLGLWRQPRSAGDWPDFLRAMQADFLHPEEDAEGQRGLREAIAALAGETARAGCAGELDRRVIRLRLGELVDERASSGGGRAFLSGRVTFCDMVPMRSLPFKVICLLGLNDGEFPRAQRPPAFDRMTAQPRPGDRNRKDDDRYLFLEAIQSARARLWLSWVGRDRRDGKERPPSPVVSELRDYLDACFAPADEPEGRIGERLLREHPMQPFSEDNYNGKNGPPSYDEAWLPAAVRTAPPLPETRLPDASAPDDAAGGDERRIELADLLAFWRNPARFFLRRRLGMRLFGDEELPTDSEPFALGGLEKHGIRAEIIRRRLRGQEPEEIGRLLVARGLLPQSHFAESALAAPLAEAEALAHVLKPLLTGPLPALPIDMSVEAGPDRFRMCGHLDELHAGGRVVWAAGRAHAGFFIDAWLGHLILAAADPGRIPARSNLAALSEHGGQADLWTFAPLAATEALALLAPWLMYYARGQNEALPFFPKSAWAWAQRIRKGEDAARAEAAALAAWQDGYQHEGERTDVAFGRLFPVADPCAVPGFRELAEALLPPLSDHLEKC